MRVPSQFSVSRGGLRQWSAALAVLLAVGCLSAAAAAASVAGSGRRPSAACIGSDCLTFQGRLVWESSMEVAHTGRFPGYNGTVTDRSFSWRGTTHSVSGVFLARSLANPERSYVSIHLVPELPDESRHLQLRIGNSGLNLLDGDLGLGTFLWSAAGLDWEIGETVEIGLREFPPQLEHRSIDGRGNNFGHPSRAMAGAAQLKTAPTSYRDGVSTPVASRPNPRTISNLVSSQQGSMPNSVGASDLFWQWGQFLDHDIVLSSDNPAEPFPIAVPPWDPVFDPAGSGRVQISLNRSAFDPETSTDAANPRRQTNGTTSFIDASHVYGSDETRALALRADDGTGRLRTSHQGRFPPFNTGGLANDGGIRRTGLFLAGDVRANEQIGLIAAHTLFVREHNRLAAVIAEQDPDLGGEEIYQLVRKIVGAQMQAITFNEFLPVLLGPDAIGPYRGYDPGVDPTIASEFSAAAFRVGHSMLSANLLLVDADGQQQPVSLARSFFNPSLAVSHGISAILRGLAAQPAQQVNPQLVDEVRNMLLRGPGGPVFDLAALNIQRGRDHGVGDYNTVRRAYGLPDVESLAEISSESSVRRSLAAAYDSIDDLDLWVGALAEDHAAQAMVGETLQTIIADQFRRLRAGDRFWFENDPYFLANPGLLDRVRTTTLADIIRRNTPIGDEIQDNVFIVPVL